MPDTATVIAKVLCPSCGTLLLNSIRCQWGVVPGLEYRLGDPIEWMRDASGAIAAPFKLIEVSPKSWRWNCGEPQFSNVVVFDEDVYTENQRLECPACKAVIAGCVLVVRDGVVKKVAALESGGVDQILGASRGKANVALAQPDGTYKVRDDWFDHPIEYSGAPSK